VASKVPAIYDTGTTLIIGDPDGIEELYATILGAVPDVVDSGIGGILLYTSMSFSAAYQRSPLFISLFQSLAPLILLSSLSLEARKSRFLPRYLTLGLSPPVALLASAVRPRMMGSSSRSVSGRRHFPGIKLTTLQHSGLWVIFSSGAFIPHLMLAMAASGLLTLLEGWGLLAGWSGVALIIYIPMTYQNTQLITILPWKCSLRSVNAHID
jgi:hypothetical protein